MGPKKAQKVTQGRAVTPCRCQGASREATEASGVAARAPKWAPEMPLVTKRKRTWVQKVSKKGSKLEHLKKSKIVFSLQRELNPACPGTPQMHPQNRVAHRKNRNEARGAQESTVREQIGILMTYFREMQSNLSDTAQFNALSQAL